MKHTKTRKLTMMAVCIALSIVLVYLIRFPIFAGAPFLEYEPADIPILICTFIYGPLAGFIVACIAALIQGMTVSGSSGIIGILMHIFATGSFVLVTGLLYKRFKSTKGSVAALVAGVVAVTVSMVIWNLIFTPLFMGAPLEQVMAMIVPFIIPFNLIKAGVNGTISLIIYNRIKSHIQ